MIKQCGLKRILALCFLALFFAVGSGSARDVPFFGLGPYLIPNHDVAGLPTLDVVIIDRDKAQRPATYKLTYVDKANVVTEKIVDSSLPASVTNFHLEFGPKADTTAKHYGFLIKFNNVPLCDGKRYILTINRLDETTTFCAEKAAEPSITQPFVFTGGGDPRELDVNRVRKDKWPYSEYEYIQDTSDFPEECEYMSLFLKLKPPTLGTSIAPKTIKESDKNSIPFLSPDFFTSGGTMDQPLFINSGDLINLSGIGKENEFAAYLTEANVTHRSCRMMSAIGNHEVEDPAGKYVPILPYFGNIYYADAPVTAPTTAINHCKLTRRWFDVGCVRFIHVPIAFERPLTVAASAVADFMFDVEMLNNLVDDIKTADDAKTAGTIKFIFLYGHAPFVTNQYFPPDHAGLFELLDGNNHFVGGTEEIKLLTVAGYPRTPLIDIGNFKKDFQPTATLATCVVDVTVPATTLPGAMQRLVAAMQTYRVDFYYTGHNHHYERNEWKTPAAAAGVTGGATIPMLTMGTGTAMDTPIPAPEYLAAVRKCGIGAPPPGDASKLMEGASIPFSPPASPWTAIPKRDAHGGENICKALFNTMYLYSSSPIASTALNLDTKGRPQKLKIPIVNITGFLIFEVRPDLKPAKIIVSYVGNKNVVLPGPGADVPRDYEILDRFEIPQRI